MAKCIRGIGHTTDSPRNPAYLSACSILGIGVFLVLWCSSPSPLYAEAAHGNIAGVVVSEQGVPVAGYINVFELEAKQGSLVPQSKCTALLDSDGKFNCASLPPGFYAVLVYMLQCPSTDASRSTPNMPGKACPRFIPYPSNADDDPLSLLRIRPEDNLSLSIVVSNEPGFEMRVEPANEAGIDKLHLSWKAGGASIPVDIEISRNAARQFLIRGLPEATMLIVENWYLDQSEHAAAAIVSTVQAAEASVVLTGPSSSPLLGHVKYKMRPEHEAVKIACAEASVASPSRFAVAIDADGNFEARDVPAALYHCTLSGPEGIFIKNVSVGGYSVDGPVLDLRSGRTAPLTIEASISTARIAGHLRGADSEGTHRMSGIAVRSKDTDMIQVFRTDANGRFQIHGLAPGTYSLYGWADIDKTPYRSVRFLRHYDEMATEIVVGENASTSSIEVDCIDCIP